MVQVPIALTPNSISATVNSTQDILLFARTTIPRQSLFFRNMSTALQTITITFGKPAVSGVGFVLNPPVVAGGGGDAIGFSNSEGYEVWQGEIYAIASGDSATLAVVEQ